jgi:hypothetical protein
MDFTANRRFLIKNGPRVTIFDPRHPTLREATITVALRISHLKLHGRFVMKSFFAIAAVGGVLGIGVCALTGCNSSSATQNKMAGDAASGEHMGMQDKMMTDKMAGDKMSGDKMTTDKMGGDKMSGDKMTTEKMSSDKMTTGKMN